MNEGYIKFNCQWVKGRALEIQQLTELNKWRDKLYSIGFIGALDNGVGFGNISQRIFNNRNDNNNNFIITGYATGNIEKLNENHYAVVNGYDLEKNSLTCTGPVKASSESMTHAVVYEISPETNAVIHIHNLKMWEKLINKVPTTDKDVTYGTPDMAREIIRLFSESDVSSEKILVMGGHKEGIISFGWDLDQAGKIILDAAGMSP